MISSVLSGGIPFERRGSERMVKAVVRRASPARMAVASPKTL